MGSFPAAGLQAPCLITLSCAFFVAERWVPHRQKGVWCALAVYFPRMFSPRPGLIARSARGCWFLSLGVSNSDRGPVPFGQLGTGWGFLRSWCSSAFPLGRELLVLGGAPRGAMHHLGGGHRRSFPSSCNIVSRAFFGEGPCFSRHWSQLLKQGMSVLLYIYIYAHNLSFSRCLSVHGCLSPSLSI